jgi:hypothetical protein
MHRRNDRQGLELSSVSPAQEPDPARAVLPVVMMRPGNGTSGSSAVRSPLSLSMAALLRETVFGARQPLS